VRNLCWCIGFGRLLGKRPILRHVFPFEKRLQYSGENSSHLTNFSNHYTSRKQNRAGDQDRQGLHITLFLYSTTHSNFEERDYKDRLLGGKNRRNKERIVVQIKPALFAEDNKITGAQQAVLRREKKTSMCLVGEIGKEWGKVAKGCGGGWDAGAFQVAGSQGGRVSGPF